MATNTNQITIPNAQDPTKPFTIINISNSNTVKLTSTNYLSWKLQIEALLIGYDIQNFIDGSHPCPPPTTMQDNTHVPNLAYHTWRCQDKLIFGALIGSLTHSLIPIMQ